MLFPDRQTGELGISGWHGGTRWGYKRVPRAGNGVSAGVKTGTYRDGMAPINQYLV